MEMAMRTAMAPAITATAGSGGAGAEHPSEYNKSLDNIP